MRIAYVCADPGVPVFGTKGSSIHVQEVIRGFLRHGAEVDLFATRLGGDVPEDLRFVRLHLLPALPGGAPDAREKAAIAANRSLDAALRRCGPFDLVYERYSLWSFAAMDYAAEAGLRSVLEVNAPLIEEQSRYRELADRSSAEAVAHRVFSAAATIIAVSRGVADYVVRYPNLRGKPHVVPNGVDPARFPPIMRASMPAARRTFTVGFVGTLKPWHGVDVLVDAFTMLHRVAPVSRLLLVGDGPERAAVEARLDAAGVREHAHLAGAVTIDRVPGLLASMDVAVAPYPDQPDFYFSPLKVYEYMAAGLPVAASRIGQLVDLIQHGQNGLLCEPGDPAALAATLERLRLDPLLCGRLGASARQKVLRYHTWDAVVQRVFRLAGIGTIERPRVAAGG
jgi:glycosyltransferase involved in cell wall biosynthesis